MGSIPLALPEFNLNPWVHAAMDVNALADARAQRSQDRVQEDRVLEKTPRHGGGELLHDPVAQVEPAPHGTS